MRIYTFLIFICVFVSCKKTSKILPNSSGAFSEVLFVVNDALWDRVVGDIVEDVFQNEIPGLGRPEASFKVIQINNSEFSSLFKTHKQIVIISNDSSFSIVDEKWAKNQLVGHIKFTGNTGVFKSDCLNLYPIFYDNELKDIRDGIAKKIESNYSNYIKQIFNIDLLIPLEYTLSLDTNNILLFSYNPVKKEEIKHLLIFSISNSSESLVDSIFTKTDKLFELNLKGSRSDSYVKIEPNYSPILDKGSYRVLWKLNNGFMGGPAIIKPYFINDKVVVVASVIFAPHSSKRKYIKEIEAIL
jgi:hypothetical protein